MTPAVNLVTTVLSATFI